MAKSDLLFFLDADITLNKVALNDILARLQERNVAAVSAPYRPRTKGFWARMQEIEYNMLSFSQGAQNWFSALCVWGGCFVVKKKAFNEVRGFSENAITEDMDLALKVKEAGYRVEQSFYHVETHVPKSLSVWFRQNIRWSSGSTQNVINHYKQWLANPL